MYKIFRGFPLVEAYQDLKKAKRLAESQAVARCNKAGYSNHHIPYPMVASN